MTTATQTTEYQSTPITRLKIGRTNATIWANQTEKGPDYGASIEQRYRDPEGIWRTSRYFRIQDLLALRELADLAIAELMKLQTPES